MFIAFAAAAVAAACSLQPHAQPGVLTTAGCYVALANDITPLLSPGEPDVAASSPECAAQPAPRERRREDAGAAARPATRDAPARAPNGG